MQQLIGLVRACLARMVEIEVVERAVALASLAFTALIPLGIVIGSLAPTADTNALVRSLVRRFKLTGEPRHLVEQVFSPPADVRSAVSVIGAALLVVSALSFTRALQRVYERAFELPRLGVRGTPAGALWLLALAVFVIAVAELRNDLVDVAGPILSSVVAFAFSLAIWWGTPWLLLSRRVLWRTLLPIALVTAAVTTAVGAGSILYMPTAIGDAARRYGEIGVAIALVSWLVVVGFAVVVCAAVGSVTAQRRSEGAKDRAER
jgi:membrane protein